MRAHHVRVPVIVLLAALAGLALGPGNHRGDVASAQGNVVTLRYATSLSEDSAYYKGAVALAQAADELSKGRLQVKIFANAQLGTDRDMIEGMQLGSIDLASPSTGAMGSVLPAATVLDLPYMFDDYAHVYRVLDRTTSGRCGRRPTSRA
jgi:TRAP-type C4-dicarboxylate transport system substrate-binding protein